MAEVTQKERSSLLSEKQDAPADEGNLGEIPVGTIEVGAATGSPYRHHQSLSLAIIAGLVVLGFVIIAAVSYLVANSMSMPPGCAKNVTTVAASYHDAGGVGGNRDGCGGASR